MFNEKCSIHFDSCCTCDGSRMWRGGHFLYMISQALQFRLITQCRFGLQQRRKSTAAVQYCGRRLAAVCQMPSLTVLLRQRIDEHEVLRKRRNGVQPRNSSRDCRMWDRRVDLSFCGRMWREFTNQQHAQQRSLHRELAFVWHRSPSLPWRPSRAGRLEPWACNRRGMFT